MGFFDRIRGKARIRSEPKKSTGEENAPVGYFLSEEAKSLLVPGYTRLSDNPEVRIAIDKIADLVSNMTIHLMENTDKGDVRVKNELSKKIDINPCQNMTRKNWVYWIVKTLLLEGDGNCIVFPSVEGNIIKNLIPLSPSKISFTEGAESYKILYNGNQQLNPEDVLHFVINPDSDKPWLGTGYRVTLRDIIGNLRQATATKKAFMSSEYMPNVIIKVDSDVDELDSEEGREKLEDRYLKRSKAGKPWIIPADLLEVQQVKPLTLKDIAINEAVELDKRTVAGILGVPAFFLGVGSYNKDEYNNFIASKIMSIAQILQQTLTKSLLVNPNWYFKCNVKSLYAYDVDTLGNLGMNLYIRGIATGNEVRGLVDFDPRDGLDALTILENFIPQEMIGEQKKLKGNEVEE
ncbi:phage portal protein [Enterococcus sp. LJL128]